MTALAYSRPKDYGRLTRPIYYIGISAVFAFIVLADPDDKTARVVYFSWMAAIFYLAALLLLPYVLRDDEQGDG